MIPPSTVFAVYGLITEQDIGKLFIAGILPGLIAVAMYCSTITAISLVAPKYLPKTPKLAGAERLEALRDVWASSYCSSSSSAASTPECSRRPRRPAWARPVR